MAFESPEELTAQLRLCLRHLRRYEDAQNKISGEVKKIVGQITDRMFLEGDYLETLLLHPELRTRCLRGHNARVLEQQARLEALHSQLEETLEGLRKGASACRSFALTAAAANCPGGAAAVGPPAAPAAAASAAAADTPAAAAFAADAAGLLETLAAAYTQQVALQQRLLLTLHELRCTDTKELQRLLLLFKARPCEYSLRRSGHIAAAEASIREHLDRQKTGR